MDSRTRLNPGVHNRFLRASGSSGSEAIQLDLNRKQAECLRYLQDHITDTIVYGGGGGGGKTWISALWCWLQLASYPRIRIGVCRKQIVDLKAFTVTFFKVVNYYHDDPRQYKATINGILNIKTGAEIVYKSLIYLPTDPNYDRLGSLELTHCILEEGQELSKQAWEAIKTRTGRQLNKEYGLQAKKLVTCNPGICWIYDYYKKRQDPIWTIDHRFIESKAEDNLQYLPSEYIENLQAIDDPLLKARIVEGRWDFADLDESRVIQSSLILKALDVGLEDGPIRIGIDLAGSATWSDKTTVQVIKGNLILPPFELDAKSYKGTSYMYDDWLSDQIIEIIESYQVDNYKDVRMDCCGLGQGVYDILRQKGYPIFSFRGDSHPIPRQFHSTAEYLNLRTQAYFELKDKFRLGKLKLTTQYTDEMVEELSAARYYQNSGKLALEDKMRIRRRLGRSPDFADALSMAALDLGNTSKSKKNSKVIEFTNKKKKKQLETFAMDLDDPSFYKTI